MEQQSGVICYYRNLNKISITFLSCDIFEVGTETDRVCELDCYCVRQAKPDHLASVGGQVFLFLGFR